MPGCETLRTLMNAARRLAERLQHDAGIATTFPVEANAVFVSMDERLTTGLHTRGWRFYRFVEPERLPADVFVGHH